MKLPPFRNYAQVLMLGSLFAVTCLVGGLVVLRLIATGTPSYGFLGWNTFLAWMPIGFGLAWAQATERGERRLVRAAWAAAWLAFLPNAPYLLTDLQHFNSDRLAPRWFDAWLFGANALNGLLLGSAALAIGHRALARTLGPTAAWPAIVVVCVLCGFGIYLGRFLRLNSWNVVTHPIHVAQLIGDIFLAPLDHPKAWFVTIVAGATQLLCYLTLCGAAALQRAALLADLRTLRGRPA